MIGRLRLQTDERRRDVQVMTKMGLGKPGSTAKERMHCTLFLKQQVDEKFFDLNTVV